MDNTNFQLLLKMLERESSARIAAQDARGLKNSARSIGKSNFQKTIEDLNKTIKQLNDTICISINGTGSEQDYNRT